VYDRLRRRRRTLLWFSDGRRRLRQLVHYHRVLAMLERTDEFSPRCPQRSPNQPI